MTEQEYERIWKARSGLPFAEMPKLGNTHDERVSEAERNAPEERVFLVRVRVEELPRPIVKEWLAPVVRPRVR